MYINKFLVKLLMGQLLLSLSLAFGREQPVRRRCRRRRRLWRNVHNKEPSSLSLCSPLSLKYHEKRNKNRTYAAAVGIEDKRLTS